MENSALLTYIVNHNLVNGNAFLHLPGIAILLTLSDPEYLDTLNTWGGQNLPAGKRWPLEASDATVEATKQTNIVSDIFLYL